VGKALAMRRSQLCLSTKVGETFADGRSTFDFSRVGVEASLHRSAERLQTDVLDVVLIHSPGDDVAVLDETAVVPVLKEWRDRGAIRAIGLSGKTVVGGLQALDWADVLMVEYHLDDRSQETVLTAAAERQVAVFVKKGLSSGRLPAADAIRFVLSHPAVTSLIIGGLNLQHFADNWRTAQDFFAN
jgi:aryl-alcohol dehydrogenase-like predicted oxidoreductase